MSLFANKIMQALCWTLVHSTWQGLLLAVVAGMVIMSTKKSAVQLRYNLLTGLLIAFLLTAAGTFYYEINLLQKTTGSSSATSVVVYQPGIDIQTGETPLLQNKFFSSAISFLNAYSGIIVLFWLCIIVVKCIQLVMGLRGVYLLKRTQVSPAGEYWTGRVSELAEVLGIKKPIQLLQSAIAKVPLITGHFKPVILLPAGILTSLPPDEIEAILLHELAHIRRKDFLVNVLQSFCEILFFFNPAVLWVSALIKEERENCCDDIAIGYVKSKKQFIHALIAFQEYNLSTEQYALAFPGKRHHLLNRVKRILTNNNKTLNTMEKLLLVSGLALTSFVVVAFTNHGEKPVIKKKVPVMERPVMEKTAMEKIAPATSSVVKIQAKPAQDTLPAKEKKSKSTHKITTSKDGKEYKVTIVDDKITELFIDDKKIPDDKVDEYKAEVDELIEDIKRQSHDAELESRRAYRQLTEAKMHNDLLREKMEKQAGLLKEELAHMERAKRLSDDQYKKSDEQIRLLKKAMQEADAKNSREEKRLLQDLAARADRDRLFAERRSKLFDSKRVTMEKSMAQKKFHLKQKQELAMSSEKFRLKSEKQWELAKERRERAEVSRTKSKQLINDITDDLTKEGVIKESDDAVSFTLQGDELIVNGVKQPEALQKKLAKKYLKSSGDHIRYSGTASSSHTDIHIDKQ